MIVMFLGGLWHGAAWSYAIWGSFHGAALAIERYLSSVIHIKTNVVIKLLKRLMVFSFITLAWLLFKLPHFEHVIEFFKSLFNNGNLGDDFTKITYIFLYSSPVLIYHLFYLWKKRNVYVKIKNIEYVFYGIMFFLIIVNSGSSNAFVYFQF
jgi:alginate O-acetyltransferase complex protein AlgI